MPRWESLSSGEPRAPLKKGYNNDDFFRAPQNSDSKDAIQNNLNIFMESAMVLPWWKKTH
jgi:hypothetical protein